ncbi:MAG: radical SAM protein [bacterium]
MTKVCHYYVTLRCNATCEFCGCWREAETQEHNEAPWPEVYPKLKEIRIKGCKELNITGGEPLLRDDLPEILNGAKQLGFKITLTTNGLLYAEKGEKLKGLVDSLYFSLDYPIDSEHDRSRGLECFTDVIEAIKLARKLGEKPRIIFTITRDSLRFLPEMVDLAEKLDVLLYLNPVYDFFGTQGFEPISVEHIKYYSGKKNVLGDLAALEFIKAGGNRVLYPRCRAKEQTVTLLPDGASVAPCFYNRGGREGKEAVCSSCMRWPYMLPSFSLGVDKYFWLNLYSDWLKGRKIS